MTFSLPALARQKGIRRDVTLRPIVPTSAQASQLAAIYAPAWQVWADNTDRILAAYDPSPLPIADSLTIDSPDSLNTLIEAIGAEFITRLVTDVTPSLRRWAVYFERWHRDKWAAAVKAGTGVDLSTVLTAVPVEETVQAFIARNVALVRNISDQAQGRISDAVFRGYYQRTPVAELTKQIREATGMAKDRAKRVAIDQTNKLSGALDRERQAEAGIEWFKWRSSHKLHYRPAHAARDGKVYDIKTHKARDGGETIPADDMPGMQPWCGCRAQAWLDL